jgi:hypothetical protein
MARLLTEAGGALLTEAGGHLLAEGSGGAAAALSGSGTLSAGGSVAVPAFTAVAAPSATTAHTFTLTPHAVHDSGGDHFIVVSVISETTADYATSLSSTNVTWDASPLVTHTVFTHNVVVQTLFKGKVTAASSATVTISFAAGNPVTRTVWQEFAGSLGYSAVVLDSSGTVDVASAGSFPSLTPAHGSGELFWGCLFDSGTGTAGSTAGFSYYIDPNGNPVAYNANCGTGAQHPNIGDPSDSVSGIAVLLYQAITVFGAGASLSGSGTLAAAELTSVRAAAALSGSGTLSGTPALAVPAAAVLLGTGSLTASAVVMTPGQVSAALAGSGTLSTAGVVGWARAAALSGTGTLTAQYTGLILQSAALAGTGVLSVAAAEALKFTAGLFGAGFLSIPQVAGGLVSGVGGAGTPQALPGSSQVAVAPPGSSNWQWLGTLGQVTALTYSYVCPGGCDKMTCTVMVPAAYRTALFDPGWKVKITRGGHQVWDGKLDEGVPTASGWNLSAVGTGNLGVNFVSYYSIDDVWPQDEPDEIINRAIANGLPWVNAGLNSSPYFSQFWFGQATDPGSSTVTAFLNLICTRGGLTWYVNSQPGGIYNGDDLSVFPLPTVPNRLLVCTTPVARTLGGDINNILIRYMVSADNTTTNTPANFNVINAVNAASVTAHGPIEAYLDLSNAGVLSPAAAQQVGQNVLALYQRASFTGTFTASYGQLLNMGGAPVDPGTDQAGNVVRMILYDYGLGGEVQPGPIDVLIAGYSWDDFQQVATLTPMQTLDMSLSGLLSMESTVPAPLTTGG